MTTKINTILIFAIVLFIGGVIVFFNLRMQSENERAAQQVAMQAPEGTGSADTGAANMRAMENTTEQAPLFAGEGKPEGWQTYNYSTSGSLQPVSFYIPPLGEYCNGCIDGGGTQANADTVRISIAGGNDTPEANAPKWRLYLYDAPVAEQIILDEETEQVYEVDLGDRKVTFAFVAYDPAFSELFDAIQQSIVFEHRPDAELP